MKRLASIFSLAIFAMLFAASCEKDAVFPTDPLSSAFTIAGDRCGTQDLCGDPLVVDIWAGQNMDAGDLTIANDAENLYVTFTTTGGWLLKQTHVHVSLTLNGIPMTKKGIPIPGQFDYQMTHNPFVDTYTYTIPLEWSAGAMIYVAAHAEVVMVDDYGFVTQEETAWGGNTPGEGPRWWYYARYTIQECDVPPPVCNDETAWADGLRYNPQGNWAMYTPYVFNTPITLWAGQTNNAGTVTFFAPVNGQIMMTFSLANGWTFNDVAENIKVQNYATAPSGNPNPGGFTWKFTAPAFSSGPYNVFVPYDNFYGIHLDLTYCEE